MASHPSFVGPVLPILLAFLPPDRTGRMSSPGERHPAFFPWGLLPTPQPWERPAALWPLCSAHGPHLPPPSMLMWPAPDPRQSSLCIALPAGARVNVCTLGCHRNTFLCKVEKSRVSFFCGRYGAMERGPGPAWVVGLECKSSDGRVHWVSLWAWPKGRGGSLVS